MNILYSQLFLRYKLAAQQVLVAKKPSASDTKGYRCFVVYMYHVVYFTPVDKKEDLMLRCLSVVVDLVRARK